MKTFIPFLLSIICIVLVMLEGSVANILIHLPFIPDDWQVTSHFLLLFTLYITIFFDQRNTYYGFAFAVLFGLIIDILYTPVIGIYLFVYGVVLYVARNLMKWLHANFFVTVLIVAIGVIIADIATYFLYGMIQFHHMNWNTYFVERLVPTFIWNILLSIVFYPFIKKNLRKWERIKFLNKD
ncbi:rod shape-determining protein MreD [Gracilibacillus marinus]|jgi:rod shape-determining protein MreD|uniref:Rod shape-determining protein MreD n=1 Tax=Gracilibacillus marinus TaxID=630535 RepID=A0ABV8VXD4_9BACI